jgi:hypothetical protein
MPKRSTVKSKEELVEVILTVFKRDFGYSDLRATSYFNSAGVPSALAEIAKLWWLYKIEAPESEIVRQQLKNLMEKGQLEYE